MAQKQKTSALNDLLDLGSRLSWKVGLPLALLCYLGFHDFSTMSNASSTANSGVAMIRQAVITLCGILQYLAPLALIVCVIVGMFRRKQRRDLLERNWGE